MRLSRFCESLCLYKVFYLDMLLLYHSAMTISSKLPYDMKADEADFSKDLLLLMLKEYELFVDSFQYACKNFKGNNAKNNKFSTISQGILRCPMVFLSSGFKPYGYILTQKRVPIRTLDRDSLYFSKTYAP